MLTIWCLTLQAQLWEQVGGDENGFFGGIYGDTVTNTLYAQAVIYPLGDTIWGVVKYNGSQWEILSEFNGFGGNGSFTRYKGDFIFGSGFTLSGDSATTNIAKWNGSGWERLGSKGGRFDPGAVRDLLVVGDDLYVGGLVRAGGFRTFPDSGQMGRDTMGRNET